MFQKVDSPTIIIHILHPFPLELCKAGPYGTYRTGLETQVIVVLSLFVGLLLSEPCQALNTEHLWL